MATQPTNQLTADDEDFGGSYKIRKPARLWTEDEIKKFNDQWETDRKNFATYLDRDANGRPKSVGVFGGNRYYHVRLANGQEAFMMGVPGDPFHVQIKPTNVPVNEGQWNTTEIRPGSGDYGNMVKTVQNATDPVSGESIGAKVRTNNLGDVVSHFNDYNYKAASTPNQARAREFASAFRNDQHVDQAYGQVEDMIKKLGPDKIKELTDWASRTGYATKNLTQDQKDFYAYLGGLAKIYNSGQSAAAGAQPTTIPQLASKALGGINLGAYGVSGNVNVESLVKALQSGDLDAYDVAANIHKYRLEHAQDSVNRVVDASNDALLPLPDHTLAEARTWGHTLETDQETPLKAGDDPYKTKDMWEIIADEKKAKGDQKTDGTPPAQTPLQKPVQAGITPEQESAIAKSVARGDMTQKEADAMRARIIAANQPSPEQKPAPEKGGEPGTDQVAGPPSQVAGQVTGAPSSDWNKPMPAPITQKPAGSVEVRRPVQITGTAGPGITKPEPTGPIAPIGQQPQVPQTPAIVQTTTPPNQAPAYNIPPYPNALEEARKSTWNPLTPDQQKALEERIKKQYGPSANAEPTPEAVEPSPEAPKPARAESNPVVTPAKLGRALTPAEWAAMQQAGQYGAGSTVLGPSTVSSTGLASNPEVGAPLGTPNDAPGVARLQQQEHVDALQPGTPFYWKDHPHAYVRI